MGEGGSWGQVFNFDIFTQLIDEVCLMPNLLFLVARGRRKTFLSLIRRGIWLNALGRLRLVVFAKGLLDQHIEERCK